MPSKDYYQASRAKAYYHANKEMLTARAMAHYHANKEGLAAGDKRSARRPRGSS